MANLVEVRDRTIRCNFFELVQNCVNQDEIKFDFDHEWKTATEKIATFTNEGASVSVSVSDDCSVIVPWEVLSHSGDMYITLTGIKPGSARIVTRKMTRPISVVASGDISGAKPLKQTQDFISDVVSKCQGYETSLKEALDKLSVINQKPWKGKLWYAYGTSLTAGTTKGYSYVPTLAEMLGLRFVNRGKAGAGIVPSLSHGGENKNRAMSGDDGKYDADLLTIEVIPNDTASTLGDVTDVSDDTFCGNLNQILNHWQTTYPDKFIAVICANRSIMKDKDGTETYPPTSAIIQKFLKYESAVQTICSMHGVDFWYGSSRNHLTYNTKGSYVDNYHPTESGAVRSAHALYTFASNTRPFN